MRGVSLVDPVPVGDAHAGASGGVGYGGGVEQQVGRASAGGVDDHGVPEGGVGENVPGEHAALLGHDQGAGGSAGYVQPGAGAGGRESGVGYGESEALGYDLGCSGGAEELASAARRGAGAAAYVLGVFERYLALGEARAYGLDHAGVLAVFGGEGDAAGDDYDGSVAHSGYGHHHGGQAPCRMRRRP